MSIVALPLTDAGSAPRFPIGPVLAAALMLATALAAANASNTMTMRRPHQSGRVNTTTTHVVRVFRPSGPPRRNSN